MFKILHFFLLLLLIGLPNSGHPIPDTDLIEKKSKFWEVYDFDIDSYKIGKYAGMGSIQYQPNGFQGSLFSGERVLHHHAFGNDAFEVPFNIGTSFLYLTETLPGRAPPLVNWENILIGKIIL